MDNIIIKEEVEDTFDAEYQSNSSSTSKNNSTVENYSGSTIENNSTVENDSSSTIENNSTVENDSSSTIENDQGLLYGNGGVCRTAPATPGLLMILEQFHIGALAHF